MFRSLSGLALGYFIYTKTGRHIAKNICLNAIPYIEEEFGISILKPIKKLTQEPCKQDKKVEDKND